MQDLPLPVPEVIDSAPKQITDRSNLGFVTPGFSKGAVFVEDSSGKLIRMSWVSEKEEAKKLRALPPGIYTIKGYRLMQDDDSGKPWHISTTSPKGIQSFTVRAGRIHNLAISPTIHINAKGVIRKGNLVVQASITGERHSGVSIYKAGKRIPMGYTISDPSGNQIEGGPMKYG